MKTGTLQKGFICTFLLILIGILVLSVDKVVYAEGETPVVLKGVTFLPSRVPSVGAFTMLREKVNKLSNGDLTIAYKGGPEAIPGREQAMAAKRGVVDIAWVPAGNYLGLVKGLEAMELSRLTSEEERKSGFYDTMLELHKKVGLYYLGRGLPMKAGEALFRINTNKKVDSHEDMQDSPYV